VGRTGPRSCIRQTICGVCVRVGLVHHLVIVFTPSPFRKLQPKLSPTIPGGSQRRGYGSDSRAWRTEWIRLACPIRGVGESTDARRYSATTSSVRRSGAVAFDSNERVGRVGKRRLWRQVGLYRENNPESTGHRVHLVHRRQAEISSIVCSPESGCRSSCAPLPRACVRAGDEAKRAVTSRVLEQLCGSSSIHEDRRLRPELAFDPITSITRPRARSLSADHSDVPPGGAPALVPRGDRGGGRRS